MNYTRNSFHWDDDRLLVSPKKLNSLIDILNNLTSEQREAVEVYARSCREEGYDEGAASEIDYLG